MKIDIKEFFEALGYEVLELDGDRAFIRHPERRAGRRHWVWFSNYTWGLNEIYEMRRRLQQIWSLDPMRHVQIHMYENNIEINLIDLNLDEHGCDVFYSCKADSEGYAFILSLIEAARLLKREKAEASDVPGTAERED